MSSRSLILAAVLWLAVLAANACGHEQTPATPSTPRAAPDFTLPTLDGEPVHLAAQQGTVVVLNFWASWCRPCLEELPLLDELHVRLAPAGGQVFGINIDKERTPALGVVNSLALKLPVLFDPESAVVEQYDPTSLPTTYLIDPAGDIVETISGKLTPAMIQELEVRVRQLLSAGAR